MPRRLTTPIPLVKDLSRLLEPLKLTAKITTLIQRLAPSLLAIYGCGPPFVVKILGETTGVEGYQFKDACAWHIGTFWSWSTR